MSTFSAVAQLERNFKKALEAYTASQNLSSLQSALLSARSLCNFGQTDKSADAFLALAEATDKNPADKSVVMDAILDLAAQQSNNLELATQLCVIPMQMIRKNQSQYSEIGAYYDHQAAALVHSYLVEADTIQSTDFYGIAQLYGAWGLYRPVTEPMALMIARALQRALDQTPPHYDGAASLLQASITINQTHHLPTAHLGTLALQTAVDAAKTESQNSLALTLLLDLAKNHLPPENAQDELNWVRAMQAWQNTGKPEAQPTLPTSLAQLTGENIDPVTRAHLDLMSDMISIFEKTRTAEDLNSALDRIAFIHKIGYTTDSTGALAYLLETMEDSSPLMPQLLKTVEERLVESFETAPLPLSHIARLYNALSQKEGTTEAFYKTLAIAIPLAQEAVAAGLWFQTKDYKGLTALLPVCEQGLEKTEAAALLERASTTLNFMKIARPDAPPLLMALANLAAEYGQPTRPFVQIALGQLQLESTAPTPDTSFAHALTEVVCFHTPASSETYLQAQEIRQRLVSYQRPEGPAL